MEGTLGIFQSILSSENNYLELYLEALDDHQSFRTGQVVDIVQTISSLLTKSKSRPLGLQLLNKFLEQCTVEVIEQKLNLWTTLVLKACNLRELELQAVPVYKALSKLAELSKEAPDINKTFSSNHLAKIYESLALVPPSGHMAALLCTETCLRFYPGSSGMTKGVVERFLSRFVDTSDEKINRGCSRCYHLLLQVRGGGVQGLNHKTQWLNYQLRVIGSLHAVLDDAFDKCVELNDDPKESEVLGLSTIQLADEPVHRAMQLYVRFRNLVGYLETALSAPFPVEKPFMPKKILNLISRGLGVTCISLQKNAISDNLALGVLLPKWHFHLLQLLQTLILTLGSHLRVHHQLILGLLADTIKWTSSLQSIGSKKPLGNLRARCYEVISLWCQTMQSGSRCEILAEFLIQEIFNDSVPFQSTFTLKVLSGARKHMSKKARRQLHKAQNDQSNLAQSHSNENSTRKDNLSDIGNQKLCVAAQRCLQAVLLSSSNYLKPTIIKIIQTKIIQLCGLFYELPLKRQQLYYNWTCRMEIYNSLFVLLMTPHHLCPPPTQMACSILQTANIRDGTAKVRTNCRTILTHLEKLIHPQKENLLFPCDIRDIRNTFIKLGKEQLLNDDLINNSTINFDEDCDDVDNDVESECNTSVTENQNLNGEHDDLIVDLVWDVTETNIIDNKSEDTVEIVSSEDSVDMVDTVTDGADVIEDNTPQLEVKSKNIVANNLRDVDYDEVLLNAPAAKKKKMQTTYQSKNADQLFPDSSICLHENDDLLVADIEAAFVDELN